MLFNEYQNIDEETSHIRHTIKTYLKNHRLNEPEKYLSEAHIERVYRASKSETNLSIQDISGGLQHSKIHLFKTLEPVPNAAVDGNKDLAEYRGHLE